MPRSPYQLVDCPSLLICAHAPDLHAELQAVRYLVLLLPRDGSVGTRAPLRLKGQIHSMLLRPDQDIVTEQDNLDSVAARRYTLIGHDYLLAGVCTNNKQ